MAQRQKRLDGVAGCAGVIRNDAGKPGDSGFLTDQHAGVFMRQNGGEKRRVWRAKQDEF